MAVEIPDRQALHVLKHLLSHLEQGPLADVDHDLLLGEGGDDADRIEDRDLAHCAKERPVVDVRLPDHRHDIVVDQGLREHRAAHVGENRDKDADDDEDILEAVILHDKCKQPLKNRSAVLDADLDAPHLPAVRVGFLKLVGGHLDLAALLFGFLQFIQSLFLIIKRCHQFSPPFFISKSPPPAVCVS